MKIQEIRQQLKDVADSVLAPQGAFVVDLEVRMEHNVVLIRIFADTDAGITINQCAGISREVRSVLETRQTLGEREFRIEVSSPGMDRPLKLLRQYPKNVGRRFAVRFVSKPEPAAMKAVLLRVEGTQLTFQPDGGEEISLPFDQIIESKEELPW